jgi:hypothetical protein
VDPDVIGGHEPSPSPGDKKYRGHIALSSFLGKDFELDIIHNVVQHLPAFQLSPFSSSTTHLLVAENRRTYKVLLAIARGLWVLSFQWILASMEANEWQKEEKYETYKWFSGVKTSRENRMKGGNGILHGLSIYLNGRGMSLSKEELVELVEAADGVIAKSVKECDYCVSTPAATLPKKTTKVMNDSCVRLMETSPFFWKEENFRDTNLESYSQSCQNHGF